MKAPSVSISPRLRNKTCGRQESPRQPRFNLNPTRITRSKIEVQVPQGIQDLNQNAENMTKGFWTRNDNGNTNSFHFPKKNDKWKWMTPTVSIPWRKHCTECHPMLNWQPTSASENVSTRQSKMFESLCELPKVRENNEALCEFKGGTNKPFWQTLLKI